MLDSYTAPIPALISEKLVSMADSLATNFFIRSIVISEKLVSMAGLDQLSVPRADVSISEKLVSMAVQETDHFVERHQNPISEKLVSMAAISFSIFI